MDLFDLAAKITLDSSGYEKGLSSASEKASGFGAKLKKAFAVGGAAVAAATSAVVGASAAFLKGASDVAAYGDNIDKMSQKMGLSAQAYQEWDAILQHSGTSIDGMQRGMMSLSAAAEKNSDAFQQLGISQEQVAAMSQEDLFSAVITGLQGMEGGSERAVLAQQLLGGAAKELGPLLNTTAEETENMRQRVHELGGVMSDDAVKASAAFQDSLQDMQTSFRGVKNQMLTQLLPSMTTVMDGVSELFSGDSEKGLGMITEGIQETASKITEVLPELIEVGIGLLESVITAVANNLPAIIQTLLPALVTSLVRIVISLVENLPAILSALWEALKAIGQELYPILQEAFSGLASWFRNKFSEAWEAVKGVFANVGQFFADIWNSIKDTFSELGTKLSDAIGGAVTAGVNKVIEWTEETINGAIRLINKAIEFINSIPGVSIGQIPEIAFGRFAIGKDYVPYDNFPAYLHKGEAVLTASEADEWRRGEGNGNEVTNNFYFNGVSQSDLDYIVAYVNRGLA